MAKLGISTGNTPNDGLGDSLLVGAIKINSNFNEIYSVIGDGSNITNSIGYASTAGIATYASTSRIVVRDSGSVIGTAGTIDFGNNLTVSAVSAGVVTVTASGGSGTSTQWASTAAGIHTLSNVGVGTTNPTSTLTVAGSGTSTSQLYVTGVSTFSGNVNLENNDKIILGSNGSPQAEIYGNGSNLIIANSSFNTGGDIYIDTDNVFIRSYNGASTAAFFDALGKVELRYAGLKKFETLGAGVTIIGTTFTNQLSVSGVSTFNDNVRVSGIVTPNSVLVSNDGGNNGSVLIEDTGAHSQISFRASNGTTQTQIQGVEANLYITPGSGGYVSLSGPTNNVFYGSGDVLLNNSSQGTTHAANGLRVTGLTSTTSFNVGTGGTIINATTTGLVGIGTTNPLSGYDLTVGKSSTLGQVSNSLKVYGYGEINGLVIKGNSSTGSGVYYDDNVIITQHPATTFTGNRNVAIGDYSFTTPGAAGENVAIGYYALNVVGNNDTLNTYNGNVGVGAFAGQSIATTLRSTFIGYGAGRYITTGNENTILGGYDGNSQGLDIRTSSNNVVLSDGAGNIRFYANSSGNVGIGTTNASSKLTVRGGDISVGVSTSHGVILTSPNGTQYRLIVDDSGTLSTVAV